MWLPAESYCLHSESCGILFLPLHLVMALSGGVGTRQETSSRGRTNQWVKTEIGNAEKVGIYLVACGSEGKVCNGCTGKSRYWKIYIYRERERGLFFQSSLFHAVKNPQIHLNHCQYVYQNTSWVTGGPIWSEVKRWSSGVKSHDFYLAFSGPLSSLWLHPGWEDSYHPGWPCHHHRTGCAASVWLVSLPQASQGRQRAIISMVPTLDHLQAP